MPFTTREFSILILFVFYLQYRAAGRLASRILAQRIVGGAGSAATGGPGEDATGGGEYRQPQK